MFVSRLLVGTVYKPYPQKVMGQFQCLTSGQKNVGWDSLDNVICPQAKL